MHGCQWQMPDGTIAGCYAKDVAEKVAVRAYPQGFESHYWHPARLEEPLKLKEPSGIFLDSMADLMGHWVPTEQITQVLDVCRRATQHTFFLLTKNAPRLLDFEFPDNVWVGVSSPPDWMFGKRLTQQQQAAMLNRTMKVLTNVKAKIRWISFEPLSWDLSGIIKQYPGTLQWAVIGGASNGRHEFPPSLDDLLELLKVLDVDRVPVFYKGNMRTLPYTVENWRESFPKSRQIIEMKVQELDLPDHDLPWLAFVPVAPPPLAILPPTTIATFHAVEKHWNAKLQVWQEPHVYIGRTDFRNQLKESIWRNPYPISASLPREACVEKYRTYITERLIKEPDLVFELEKLRGKILVCWCKNTKSSGLPCHGDVLLELLGEAQTPLSADERRILVNAERNRSGIAIDGQREIARQLEKRGLLRWVQSADSETIGRMGDIYAITDEGVKALPSQQQLQLL